MKIILTESNLKPPLTAIRKHFFVATVTLGVFASVLSTSMLITSFIEISSTFNVPLSTFHIRSVLFFAIFAINLPLFGSMCEDIGPKRQFICGLCLFMFATFMCSFSSTWAWFVFFQCLQALADSLIVSTMSILFRLYIPEENLGWAFGFQSAILSSAGLLGPPIGAFLTSIYGWQSIYTLLTLISFVAFVLTYFSIPNDSKYFKKLDILQRHPFENTLYIFIGFIIIFMLTELNSLYWILIILPCLLLALFRLNLVERDRKKPHIISINGTREYYNNLLRVFLIYTSSNILFLFFPTLIRELYHVDSIQLGVIITLDALIPLCLGIYIGKLIDKFPYLLLKTGLLLNVIIFLIILTLPIDAGIVSFSIIYLLIGLVAALVTPSQWKIAFFSIPKINSGKFTGLYLMIQFLSGGIASVMYVFFSKYSLQNNLYLLNFLMFCCMGLNLTVFVNICWKIKGQEEETF